MQAYTLDATAKATSLTESGMVMRSFELAALAWRWLQTGVTPARKAAMLERIRAMLNETSVQEDK